MGKEFLPNWVDSLLQAWNRDAYLTSKGATQCESHLSMLKIYSLVPAP